MDVARKVRPALAPVFLLLALACQPQLIAPVYGPWEEGLTLSFEDPSLPQPQRAEARFQVRVARSTPETGSLVLLDHASSSSHTTQLVRYQDGGISLMDEGGKRLSQPLPAGFPGTTAWVDGGTAYRVVGRAAWAGAALLPPTADPVGVWVEAQAGSGPRHRSLYLPNLGEVECLEERGGEWVTIRRLVARGFTDAPSLRRP
jgi:hypothetical protein